MQAELRIGRTPESRIDFINALRELGGVEDEVVTAIAGVLNAVRPEFQELATFLDNITKMVDPPLVAGVRALVLDHLQPELFYPVYDRKDFTFFLDTKQPLVAEAVTHFLRRHSGAVESFSYDCRIEIRDPGDPDKLVFGRVLACRCFGGNYISFTFRKESGGEGDYPLGSNKNGIKSEYQPLTSRNGFRNGIAEICLELNELLRTQLKPEARGLVVVTGRTASAKSQITRGLIYEYLHPLPNKPGKNGRVPHLLTYEDPIENKYFGAKVDPIKAQQLGIDYTAREKHKDVLSLADALKDALRQTPSVVFVGETREKKEWKALIDFAGTGHLVFTTAHAGSLSEAMGKIFEHTGTKTPSDRSVIADRLLALIHVRYEQQGGTAVLIPTLWRNTPEGAKALIAEGRASLLPHNDKDSFCVGRYWFAEELEKRACKATGRPWEFRQQIATQALAWDLEGS
jgi:type II/IV secretion system protein